MTLRDDKADASRGFSADVTRAGAEIPATDATEIHAGDATEIPATSAGMTLRDGKAVATREFSLPQKLAYVRETDGAGMTLRDDKADASREFSADVTRAGAETPAGDATEIPAGDATRREHRGNYLNVAYATGATSAGMTLRDDKATATREFSADGRADNRNRRRRGMTLHDDKAAASREFSADVTRADAEIPVTDATEIPASSAGMTLHDDKADAETPAGDATEIPATSAGMTLRDGKAVATREFSLPQKLAYVREAGDATETHILRAASLYKSFRRKRVVQGIDFAMQTGEVLGLLGPNGSGKTTTFYMIVGFYRPTAGEVFLDGTRITKLPMFKRARLGISYLPQEPSVFRKLTVEENIWAILETLRDLSREEKKRRLEQLIEEFDIGRIRKQPAFTLSGGERRRTEIARSLAIEPKFLLLDEPFAGIDPIAVADIKNMIRLLSKRGIGILVTDHNVRDTLEITHRAIIINQGQIMMQGTRQEILDSPVAHEIYLGKDFSM